VKASGGDLYPLGAFKIFIVTSNSACLSPDGTILVLLGELNYQAIEPTHKLKIAQGKITKL
jgi:hypothetical protein